LVSSAVSEFLSFRICPTGSRIRVIGSPQERPPSVERLTSMALRPNVPLGRSGSKARLMK
jgi:hypothetical protein